MSKTLFNDFNAVSAKQWKQKIQFDLQGADYNQTLIWKSSEDIAVKPFYHADDFETLPNPSNTKATQWRICESIYVANTQKSNINAIKAIESGANSIQFFIPNAQISISDLILNIDLDNTEVHFILLFSSEDFIKKIPNHDNAFVHFDVIGNLSKSGNWFNNLKADIASFKSYFQHTKTISIDVNLYQNAGANMVQQLAYALAHANEYLTILDTENNNNSAEKIVFNVAIGSNYFFEIAKLKALRILWQTLAEAYNINKNCYIFATPTRRNKTIYDFNTNLLRTTTECMSAILGGANTICNLAYDSIYHKPNAFGNRIARNQLLILEHESYFKTVNNPTDGSYYIETLTNQLAEKALTLFKTIEENGGFLQQLKSGTIQRKIKESADKEQHQFNENNITLVGTNKYSNPNDKMTDKIELYPFVKINPRKTLIAPIIAKRLAEKLEETRLKNEA